MAGTKEAGRMAELRKVVKERPGAPEFVELAIILAKEPTSRAEAREVCFRGLVENPKNARGRLALARAFYLDGMWEFAVRELVELRRVSDSPAIQQLIEAFGDYGKQFLSGATIATTAKGDSAAVASRADSSAESTASEESVLADMDIDADLLEALDELEDDQH